MLETDEESKWLKVLVLHILDWRGLTLQLERVQDIFAPWLLKLRIYPLLKAKLGSNPF
jgi:hypothetical protein